MSDLLKFTVPGKKEYISVVRLAVSSAANAAGFDIEEIEDIKTAVTEVCSNIFCDDESGEGTNYQVECNLEDGRMIISINDCEMCAGSEPANLRKCNDLPVSIMPGNPGENISSRNAGLFMLRTLMDEVDIFSEAINAIDAAESMMSMAEAAFNSHNTLIRMIKYISRY